MSDDEDLYCNPETNIFLQTMAASKKPKPQPQPSFKAPFKSPGLPERTPSKPPKPAFFKRKVPVPVPSSEESAKDELKNLFKNGLKRPSEFRLTPAVSSNENSAPKSFPKKPAVFPPSQEKEVISPFPKLRHVEGSVLSKPTQENESISPSRLRQVSAELGKNPPPVPDKFALPKPDECPTSIEVDVSKSPSAPAVPRRTSRLSSCSGSQENIALINDPTSASPFAERQASPLPESLNSPTLSAKSADSAKCQTVTSSAQPSAMFEPPPYNQYGQDDPEELYTDNDLPPIPQEEPEPPPYNQYGQDDPEELYTDNDLPPIPREEPLPKRRALKPISAPPRIPLETFPGTYNPEEDPEEMYNDTEIEMYPLNPNLPPPAPKINLTPSVPPPQSKPSLPPPSAPLPPQNNTFATPPSDEESDEELYADADFPEPLQPPRLASSFPSPLPSRAPPPISPMPTRAPPPMQAPPPRGPTVCPPLPAIEDPKELEQFEDPDEMYTENDLPLPAPYSPYNPDFEDDEELYADPDFAENIPHQPDPSPIPPPSEYNPEEEGDEDIYADIDEYMLNKQVQSMINPGAPPPPPGVQEISTPDLPNAPPPPVKDKKQKKGLLSIFKKKKEGKSTECINSPDDVSTSSFFVNNSEKEAEKSHQKGSESETDFEDDELYADGDAYPDCDEIYELEE